VGEKVKVMGEQTSYKVIEIAFGKVVITIWTGDQQQQKEVREDQLVKA
jgi:hypothetical protein